MRSFAWDMVRIRRIRTMLSLNTMSASVNDLEFRMVYIYILMQSMQRWQRVKQTMHSSATE
jgi:hypothetical protein